MRGIACCDSRRAFLTSTPAVYAHELTDYLRFVQPGEYRIQYETRRVFEASPIRGFEPSDLLVRSNIIRIKIIEDDPRWLEGTLAASLAVVDAPPPLSELLALPRLPMQGSLQAPILGEALVRYRRAAQQLRMLDTPEAIRARVARIQLPSADQWRTLEAKQVAYQGVDTSVLHSSRPDLVAAALRERAAEPGFGVMRGYFELWVNVLIERDHPELVRLTRTRALREQETERELRMPVIRELLDTMRELNGSKTGLAAEITGATLRWVERDLERR